MLNEDNNRRNPSSQTIKGLPDCMLFKKGLPEMVAKFLFGLMNISFIDGGGMFLY